MSDLSLRQMERAAAQGDRAAQARLLLERVRTGDLGRDRLRLVAYLGQAQARDVLGEGAPQAPADPVEWVRGLEPFGRRVCARAGHIAASVNYTFPGAEHAVSDRVVGALDAAGAWLADPRPERERAVRSALDVALEELFRRPRTSYTPRVFNGGRAGTAAVAVVLHPSTILNTHYQPLIGQSLGLRAYTYSLGTLAAAAFYWTAATALMTRVELREHVRSELLDWASMD